MTQTFREFDVPAQAPVSIWQKIGLPAGEGPKLNDEIRRGFCINVVKSFAKEVDWPVTNIIDWVGVSRATYNRRVRSHHRLKADESEAIARLVRVVEAATTMMNGDQEEAIKWLQEPAIALGGKKPIELLVSESGTVDVIRLIQRVMHGIYF